MLGYLLAALLVASAMTQSVADASGIEWCAEDPAFTVLGAEFDITTSINAPESAVERIDYVVEVPSNAGDVGVTYPGTSAEMLAKTFVVVSKTGKAYVPARGSFRVDVKVTVSAPDRTRVIAALGGPSVEARSVSGHTNRPIKLHFNVTP